MKKQVVMITGAVTGIGHATALAFGQDGANLVVSGRNAEAGEALVKELRALGAEAEFVLTDVTREDDVRTLIEKTVQRFGRLDVAVNCAGTAETPGSLVDQTLENYTKTFDTNVLGTFLALKHELKVMIPQGSGSIINMSSTLGQKAALGTSIYAATKHAVEGLTKTAALEAASANVRVNAVAPGPIDTGLLDRVTGSAEKKADMIAGVPLKRLGRPEEIAQMILFLASDKAPFITGQIFGVDGGKMA
jgi:NAD(P)-dependent dehydrogenase (short-subunit alcohol dehydrogenase family)